MTQQLLLITGTSRECDNSVGLIVYYVWCTCHVVLPLPFSFLTSTSVIEALRFEAESWSQTPSSIWTEYPQYWQLFTTCTTATMQLLGISICTTIYDRVYHWTAEQFQVDRVLLSLPIRNYPSGIHTTAAPSHRYVERGYVCAYINCGHYSRLGDIKMFERLYNCVWCTFHMFLEINFMWLPVECHAYLCNCTWL